MSWIERGGRPSCASMICSSRGSIMAPTPETATAQPGNCAGSTFELLGCADLLSRRWKLVLRVARGQHGPPGRLPPQRLIVGHHPGVGKGVTLGERFPVLADDPVADLTRHHPAEPRPGLRLDVRRVSPAVLLALQVFDVALRRGDAGAQAGEMLPLLEVGAHARR